MEIADIIPHVEALIFASDHPLAAIEILDFLNQSQGFLEDQVNINQVITAIDAVTEKYHSAFYSFEVVESGGGYQFLTKPAYHATVARLNGDKYLKRLSKASLETLAIIAYKQPVTKSDIEGIRGVNSDYSVQKLLEKELIAIRGRREDAPGKPLLYVTSESFMDYFGLNSPDDLPKIKEVKEEASSQPTLPPVNPSPEALKEAKILSVKEGNIAEITENEPLPEANGSQGEAHPVHFSEEIPETTAESGEITESAGEVSENAEEEAPGAFSPTVSAEEETEEEEEEEEAPDREKADDADPDKEPET